MRKTTLTPDESTGEFRFLYYDANGYRIVVGDRVVLEGRLRAVCYLLGPQEREVIARLQGLQDAGELARAQTESNAVRGHPLP